jgi:hypothetical protein
VKRWAMPTADPVPWGGAGFDRACGNATRQTVPVKTCCGISPWRRANARTFAPSATVSAKMVAFSSADHVRRRPGLVKTSARRTGSDRGASSLIDLYQIALNKVVRFPDQSCAEEAGYGAAHANPDYSPAKRTG